MKYDLVVLGGGNLTRHLVRKAAEVKRHVLVVTDQSSESYKHQMNYEDFWSSSHNFVSEQMIIASRFDRVKPETFDSLLLFFEKHEHKNLGVVTFISSVAVYPDSESLMTEQDADPASDYGKSKLASEERLRRALKGKLIALRVSNLYGGSGLSELETQIKRSIQSKVPVKVPVVPVSRDFIYVGDLIKFFLGKLSLSMDYGTYNFASGKPTLIDDFVLRYASQDLTIERTHDKPTIQHSNISIEKFVGVTNFVFTSLNSGIDLARKSIL